MKVFIGCHWFDFDQILKELESFENTKILTRASLTGDVGIKVESTDECFPEYIEKMIRNYPLRKVIVV